MNAVKAPCTNVSALLTPSRRLNAFELIRLKGLRQRLIKRSVKGKNTALAVHRFDINGSTITLDIDFSSTQCKNLVGALRGALNSSLGKGTF